MKIIKVHNSQRKTNINYLHTQLIPRCLSAWNPCIYSPVLLCNFVIVSHHLENLLFSFCAVLQLFKLKKLQQAFICLKFPQKVDLASRGNGILGTPGKPAGVRCTTGHLWRTRKSPLPPKTHYFFHLPICPCIYKKVCSHNQLKIYLFYVPSLFFLVFSHCFYIQTKKIKVFFLKWQLQTNIFCSHFLP